MLRKRIIPCLLLKEEGLVKTVKFKQEKYIGDPINALKIFNEKEVDELVFLDISATERKEEPHYDLLSEIASECFMPLAYGGGIHKIEQISKILSLGFEKVVINTAAVDNPDLIKEAAQVFGSSTIVVSIDVKKNLFGKYQVYTKRGTYNTKLDPVKHAANVENLGAGEVMLNSIDRDGTMSGYDIALIAKVSNHVSIPIIASGGAGNLQHFYEALTLGKASAAAAGSFFVFHGKNRAVLINYPSEADFSQSQIF
ncbi:AglZ/HisF2 family acetamidino modification protein [Pontibacter akesuensis]|uniref:imidazole glycerol-phosphate synthase n=1 Tax=Pontibacter akesuensis TaxID=388950 RepID=A0A1I7GBK6_9BACT|nr:AglZ/HisF2 family acetamidino modification protein [Pontibacter akesuensis]GHA57641.1 putative imidazole glycerol phosphate synthase subunit hisF2 [Pontibacter akesuensis]SFU45852.1 cyclase [Pontibacter akesuensis]